MKNIYGELTKFGLGNTAKQQSELYKYSQVASKKQKIEKPADSFDINNYVYAKSYSCPVCDTNFKNNAARESKLRVKSVDYDLHPICSPIDPVFYGVVSCGICGYTSTENCFGKITLKQIELIQKGISFNFVAHPYPVELDIDMAIERYKLALLNAAVKQAKDSEKAYICMKLTWLYKTKKDTEGMTEFAKLTVSGFTNALLNEYSPIMGMSDSTIYYLLGAFSMTIGKNQEALKFLSHVITSKSTSNRLKDKALDLRAEICRRPN